MTLHFDNRLLRELPVDPLDSPRVRQVHGAACSRVQPTPVAAPQWLAVSAEAAALLGPGAATLPDAQWLQVLAGNALLPGMAPFAACYGGHQFGHWAGQLGDGRAISLGEVLTPAGERWELQLKGAGQTPYSRHADGRAVLRSSLREFVCSEAMHHLGVPTTRALSLITTGERVVRDMFYDGRPRPEPGAIVCRMAPSFLRFGSFELPAARGDEALLAQLVDFCIARDFPELAAEPDRVTRRLRWFEEIVERTALLIAHWMRVGFVHGVMNTDNMSVLGLTIDYGPYGWLEDYDPEWTPNTSDAEHRRYRFGAQPAIAHWNLWQLANAIYPLIGETAPLERLLDSYSHRFAGHDWHFQQHKLGLEHWRAADDETLHADLLTLLRRGQLDMTLFYRQLASFDDDSSPALHFADAFYDEGARDEVLPTLAQWLQRYRARLAEEARPAALRMAQMNAVNPLYVPRNYLLQQAIEAAEAGDSSVLERLMTVLRQPYEAQEGAAALAARRPEWARHKAGCGMLSCSS